MQRRRCSATLVVYPTDNNRNQRENDHDGGSSKVTAGTRAAARTAIGKKRANCSFKQRSLVEQFVGVAVDTVGGDYPLDEIELRLVG